MSASTPGSEMPARFCEPGRFAAAEPQYSRCSLPGDSDWPQLFTSASKSKLRRRFSYCASSTERTLTLRFDFLDPGKTYTATIYKDGEGATYLTDARHRIAYDNIRVKKGDTYRLWLAPGGGAAMRLHPGR